MIGKIVQNEDKVSKSHVERAKARLDYVEHPAATAQLLASGWVNAGGANNALATVKFCRLAGSAPSGSKPVRHVVFSWPSAEQPTAAQCEETVKEFLRQAGLNGCIAKWGVHGDTDNVHLHIAVCTVDPDADPRSKRRMRKVSFAEKAAHRTCAVIEHRFGFAEEPGAYCRCDSSGVPREIRPYADSDAAHGGRAGDAEYRSGKATAIRIAHDKLHEILALRGRPRTWAEFMNQLTAAGMRYELVYNGDSEPGALVGVRQEDGSFIDVKASAIKLLLGDSPRVRSATIKHLAGLFDDAPGAPISVVAGKRIAAVLRTLQPKTWAAFHAACEREGIRYQIRRPQYQGDVVLGAHAEVQVLVGDACHGIKATAVKVGDGDATYRDLRKILGHASGDDVVEHPAVIREPRARRARRAANAGRYAGGPLERAWDAYRAVRATYVKVHGDRKRLKADQKREAAKLREALKVAKKDAWSRQKSKAIKPAEGNAIRSQLEHEYAQSLRDLHRDYAARIAAVEPYPDFDDWLEDADEFQDVARERSRRRERVGIAVAIGIQVETVWEAREDAVALFAGMHRHLVTVSTSKGPRAVMQYSAFGRVCLEDRGREVLFKSPRDPDAVRAGLQLSLQKFGRFTLSGTPAFLVAAAREAVAMGLVGVEGRQDLIVCDDPWFQRTLKAELAAKERREATAAAKREAVNAGSVDYRALAAGHAELDRVLGADRYEIVAERQLQDGDGALRRGVGPVHGIRTRPVPGLHGHLAVRDVADALRHAHVQAGERIGVLPVSRDKLHVVLEVDRGALTEMTAAGHNPVLVLDAGGGKRQVVLQVPAPSDSDATNNAVNQALANELRDRYCESLNPISLRCPGDGVAKIIASAPGVECPAAGNIAKEIAAKIVAAEDAFAPDPRKSGGLELAWDAHRQDVLKRLFEHAVDESRLDFMIGCRMCSTGHSETEVAGVMAAMSRRARGATAAEYVRKTVERVFGAAGEEAIEGYARYHKHWAGIEDQVLGMPGNRKKPKAA